MKVRTLFAMVKSKARRLNEANPNFNGLDFWHTLKGHLAESPYKARGWKLPGKATAAKVMSLPEYTIDGHEKKTIVAKNHFLIQTVRIPLSEPPTLRKIMQVALNVGQYQGKKGAAAHVKGRTRATDYLSKADAEAIVPLPEATLRALEKKLT